MKYSIAIIVVAMVGTSVFAQSEGFRTGARFGIGQSSFVDYNGNQEPKLALSGGVSVSNQFSSNVGLTADVLFSSKGAKATGEEDGTFGRKYTDTYRLFYAELPIAVKLSAGSDNFYFKVFGGPSLNFNLLGTETRTFEDGENDYIDKQINSLNIFELAGVVGAGFDVESASGDVFFLDFKYSVGLGDFGTIQDVSGKNTYFSIGVGYLYR